MRIITVSGYYYPSSSRRKLNKKKNIKTKISLAKYRFLELASWLECELLKSKLNASRNFRITLLKKFTPPLNFE
jgi:hypothetical protein